VVKNLLRVYFENCVLGLNAVLCTGAAGSQKLPPPGMGVGFVGSTGGGGAYHPSNITAAEARTTTEKIPIAIGSRHQAIRGRVVISLVGTTEV
jgi:hypothetical protein